MLLYILIINNHILEDFCILCSMKNLITGTAILTLTYNLSQICHGNFLLIMCQQLCNGAFYHGKQYFNMDR